MTGLTLCYVVVACGAPIVVVKLMEMHGDNTTEDVGVEMEREDEGEEVEIEEE